MDGRYTGNAGARRCRACCTDADIADIHDATSPGRRTPPAPPQRPAPCAAARCRATLAPHIRRPDICGQYEGRSSRQRRANRPRRDAETGDDGHTPAKTSVCESAHVDSVRRRSFTRTPSRHTILAVADRIGVPVCDCGIHHPLDKLRGLLGRSNARGMRAAACPYRRELRVSNSIAHGWRVVVRMTALQLAATLVVAGVMVVLVDASAGGAALFGGSLMVAASAVSGTRALIGKPVSAGRALTKLVSGVLLRWLIVLGGLGIALVSWKLPPLPLMTGLGATLLMNLVGIAFEDR